MPNICWQHRARTPEVYMSGAELRWMSVAFSSCKQLTGLRYPSLHELDLWTSGPCQNAKLCSVPSQLPPRYAWPSITWVTGAHWLCPLAMGQLVKCIKSHTSDCHLTKLIDCQNILYIFKYNEGEYSWSYKKIIKLLGSKCISFRRYHHIGVSIIIIILIIINHFLKLQLYSAFHKVPRSLHIENGGKKPTKS